MATTTPWFDLWLSRTALAGAVLLLMGLFGMLITRQPARRQRLGELALLSSLLVALLAALPSWWELASATSFEPVPSQPVEGPQLIQPLAPIAGDALSPTVVSLLLSGDLAWAELDDSLAQPTEFTAAAEAQVPAASAIPWLTLLGVAYFSIMLMLLVRCGLGYWGLVRLWRRSRPVPVRVREMLNELAPTEPRPRLAMTDRLPSPISFGLRSPTILLPAEFCRPGNDVALRSVLLHELTHLERRDAWSTLLLALSQSVYFYVPWFWWLKRQVRLAQEFIADAAAASVFSAVDYAQYLVNLSAVRGSRSLALARANGVFQTPSDLSRRVEMLLNNPSPPDRQVPRSWSFAAAGVFLLVAMLMSGVRLHAAEQAASKEEEPVEDRRFHVITDDGKVREDGDREEVEDVLLLVSDDGDEDGPQAKRWVFVVSPQEKEHLAKLQAALEALKAAAKRLGDDVPPEVKKQLADVEKQLAEAKGRLAERGAQWREKGQAEAERARATAERFAAQAREQAENARTQAEQQARDAAGQARARAEAEVKRLKEREVVARKELESLRQQAEELAAETKKRLQRLANDDDDAKREAELDAVRTLSQKTKALKARLQAAEQRLQAEMERAKAAEASARAAEAAAREAGEGTRGRVVAPRAPMPPVPPVMSTAPRFSANRMALIHQPRLGVKLEPVPPVLASQMKLEDGTGLVILEVVPESAAAGKLEKFDVLLEVDGKPVKADVITFSKELSGVKGDQPVRFRVLRGGRKVNIEAIRLPEAKGGSGRVWVESPGGDGSMAPARYNFVPRQVEGKDGTFEFKIVDPKDAVELKDHLIQVKPAEVKLKPDDVKRLKEDVRFEIKLDHTKELQNLKDAKIQLELKLDDMKKLPALHEQLEKTRMNIQELKLEKLNELKLAPELKDKLIRVKPTMNVETIVEPVTSTLIRKVPGKEGEVELKVITGQPATEAIKRKLQPTVPPQVPATPKAPPAPKAAPERRNVNFSINRDNDEVRVRRQENEETIVIRARMENGKVVIEAVEVDEGTRGRDGQKSIKRFRSLDEVDGKFKEKVKKMLDAAEKGQNSASVAV